MELPGACPDEGGVKRWSGFLPITWKGQELSCHDKTSKRYQVPISGRAVSCHDEIVSVTSKKQVTSASADSANDAVPGDETVQVLQDSINGTEFKGINVGIDHKSVLALAKAIN